MFNNNIFHRRKKYNLVYDINLQMCVKATHWAMKSTINQVEFFICFWAGKEEENQFWFCFQFCFHLSSAS